MFEQAYQRLMDAVGPDEALKRRTLSAMREAERGPRPPRRLTVGLTVAAVCLLLAVSLTLLPLLRGPAVEDTPPSGTEAVVSTPQSTSDSAPGVGSVPADSAGADPAPPSEAGDPEENQDGDRVLQGERRALTQQEVYALPVFGALAPTALIEGGYRFESASLYTDQDGWQSLVLSFTQPMPGLDYVTVTMRDFAQYPEDAKRVVSVEEEERYDITRYSIPLADSVPEALRETVWDPIFRAGELTEQALRLRRLARNEGAEDDAAYFMLFSVLCDETLVQYSIKGDALDGVLEMVRSSAYFRAEAQG